MPDALALGMAKLSRHCIGWIAAGSLLLSTWAPDVTACSPPATGWFGSLLTAQVPTDGLVLVAYSCTTLCDPLDSPTIVVRDEAGIEVSGELTPVTDVSGYSYLFGWRATNPLEPGPHRVVLNPEHDLPSLLEVVPSIQVGADALTVAEVIGIDELSHGTATCCPAGPLDSCGDRFCFNLEVRRVVGTRVTWESPNGAAHWGQYVHRVSWNGGPPSEWRLGENAVGSFETQSSEYCYDVELKSLNDGSLERIEGGCIPHPADAAELGVFDVDATATQANLGVCEEPPPALREPWCVARTNTCATHTTTGCENVPALCAGVGGEGGEGGEGSGGEGSGGEGSGGEGSGGEGSGGEGNAGSGAGSGGAAASPSDTDDDDRDGGCSIGAATTRQDGALAAMLALLLGFVARRRRT